MPTPGAAKPRPPPLGAAGAKAQPAGSHGKGGQMAGVRVNLPDKHPVVGRHPAMTRLGLLNGLGSKGALHAPALARQWVNHLTEGVPFDAEVDVARFFGCPASQALSP